MLDGGDEIEIEHRPQVDVSYTPAPTVLLRWLASKPSRRWGPSRLIEDVKQSVI